MDVLSDTLQVVRLSGAIFLDASLALPWAFEAPSSDQLAQYLRLPTDCVALFHILVRGEGWFAVPGYTPVLLRAGDAILLPHCTPHRMCSDHITPALPMSAVLPPYPAEGIVTVATGGMGDATQFICGFLHCDQRFNPLLGALPALIVVRPRNDHEENDGELLARRPAKKDLTFEAPATVLHVEPGDWLGTTLHHTVEEALGARPGNG